MSKFDYILTCAGWEERFFGSVNNFCNQGNFDKLINFSVTEFSDLTISNLDKLRALISSENLIEKEISLTNDSETWLLIEELFDNLKIEGKNILIDITTMPRFLIWFLMHFSTKLNNKLTVNYFKPERYESCDWLTSDATSPRLVFKHSGIHLPDQQTLLIIQSGFDIERVNQLIYSYEPAKVLVGAQIGEQFNNASKSLKNQKERLKYQEIEYFELNAYEEDYGYAAIDKLIGKYKDTYNIILASFGPKPVAVTMFKLSQKHEEIGLSYVLVNTYNNAYSHGTSLSDPICIQYEKIYE